MLLYNKRVLYISVLIPQDEEFCSGHVLGWSSSIFESIDLMNLEKAFK
jgi:hypothetical protein